MEAAAGAAAAPRGVSQPMASSQPYRKEWRVVSEVRNAGGEDLERSKLGQSDERTIYEVQKGRDPAGVDFCSITINGSSDDDILQQQLHSVGRQREELQQLELGLRAQIIARSNLIEMQNSYEEQIKVNSDANAKLQEQLHEMEQAIRELERRIQEKDRELHAIKIDNEAVWAKEDLLREQSKELQNFRRERENAEVERGQHLKQIQDFQELFQEKERQFLELQEQNRVAQEAIQYRDEQLRDAQAWITRAQEIDVIQTSSNQNLQAELRERTDQYNQLWLGCQRQFAEMERVHVLTVQQLQLQLAELRERSGIYPAEQHVPQSNSNGSSDFGQNNGNQMDGSESAVQESSTGELENGNPENAQSFVSTGNASTQADHAHGVPISPSSLLGMPTYLPNGQVTTLHPYVMHQQGVSQPVPSHATQSHVGHFHPVPAFSSIQHWQTQLPSSEDSQPPNQNQYPQSQANQNLLGSDANYEVSANGQDNRSDYLDSQSNQVEPGVVIPSSVEKEQVQEQVDKSYQVPPQSQQILQPISTQFRDLRLESDSQESDTKEKLVTGLSNQVLGGQVLSAEQRNSVTAPSEAREIKVNNATGTISSEAISSSGQKNVHAGEAASEAVLLDERSLLSRIVRTMPPGSGGKIRISSTLPNRLSKMLAPLHWHDYKKKYGKLDDFVAGHPELFVIEGDYIQLREGAQEIIAATTAVAKVAAAAKTASSPYSSLLPSVAVTPMAQSHRSKRAVSDNVAHSVRGSHSNGVSPNDEAISNVKILSKPRDPRDSNDYKSMPGRSGLAVAGNGANPDRSVLGSYQSKGSTNARTSSNFVRK